MKQRKGKWLFALTTVFALCCAGVAIADNESATAGQPLKLSLSQAISTALENNSSIEIAQLQIDSLDVSLKELNNTIRKMEIRDLPLAAQTQDYFMLMEITPAKTEAARDLAVKAHAYTKNSILNESAMAMLAQANKQPQSILTLLQ